MKKKDHLSISQLRNYHDELWHTPQGKAIREVVFGTNDGLISMIGFIAGLIGANASRIILVGGFAELIAGAISMALGAYLSTKSQVDFFSHEIEREKREIQMVPERERDELVDIYRDYGFTEEEVQMIVNRITSSEEMWLKFMIKEELGLIEDSFDNPIKNGLITGISFIVGSIPPLLPFLITHFLNISPEKAFMPAITLSILSLFLLGVGKARVIGQSVAKGGIEVLSLGLIASVLGFAIGHLVSLLLL